MARVVVINLRRELASEVIVLAAQREEMADQFPSLLRRQSCGIRLDLLEAHGFEIAG